MWRPQSRSCIISHCLMAILQRWPGRDVTSARADMKWMEGRVVKASEEIAHIKNDMGQLGEALNV